MSVSRLRQLFAAFLLLAAGILVLSNVLSGPERTQAADIPLPSPKFQIVSAVKPLTRGSAIHADDVVLTETTAPPSMGTVTNMPDAIERAVMRNIASGETISDANTAATPKGIRLSELVPPGLRAIAIRVTDETSVANLVQPSDRVDVLLVSNAVRTTLTGSQPFPPAEAVTLLQNVPVLAVGDTIVGGNASKPAVRNVTLAVTPEQAAVVAMLGTVGTSYLTLRSRTDESVPSIATVTTGDIRPQRPENSPPPAREKVTRRQRSIEVIAGASANTSRVAIEGSE